MNRLMNMAAITWLCTISAICYGIIHDQITVRVCLEYFTIGHYPIFGDQPPTILGLLWGIAATWWMGFSLGFVLALIASLGKNPVLPAKSLVKPITTLLMIMGVCALGFGILGYFLASTGRIELNPLYAAHVEKSKHAAFLADGFAHSASYLSGLVGGIILMVQTWRKRLLTDSPVSSSNQTDSIESMGNKFKQYDAVELIREMMSNGSIWPASLLRAGQRGVIVEIYSSDKKGYDVEFFDDAGNTVALMVMKEDDIRHSTPN